jgi:hypothetical protein
VVASDDPEKAYLEVYAVARQAADAVDGLVGKLNSAAAANFVLRSPRDRSERPPTW